MFEPAKRGDIAKPCGASPGPTSQIDAALSGLGGFYAGRKLGLTPQALRFHRFAVGKAGCVRAPWLISRRKEKKEHRPARTAS